MTDDNREKFIQIAERYGQPLKFYNVEELCAEEIAKIHEFFPNVGVDRHSIAMFYRFFIPKLLLPQGIEKTIYLDSDIVVNLDISELWQIDLGDKPFGAIPEVYQIKDMNVAINTKRSYILICKEGFVNTENYLNSGVLLMNLKVLHEEKDTLLAGMKFISEHPQFEFLDQDILNYCFSTTYLKLPLKFNRFVLNKRRESDFSIEKKIYHYAANRLSFIMNSSDPYNQLFMDYFIKTPWVDDDAKAVLSGTKLPSRKNFAVSVVIPMYNAEEFIGECLDSLLIQTFQDFEVIVVDDCSTDSSYAIVKEYAPKFNGRLRLEQTEKNSGGGGYIPRNIGLMLARGEYIQFLDADDMILGTALETFYMAAILYDAEVVYTSSRYRLKALNDIYLQKDAMSNNMKGIQTNFNVDGPNTNLSRLLLEGNGHFHTPWTHFCRREFLIKNQIFFAPLSCNGDFLWLINLYCYAKRFLRIATPLYLYRLYNVNSITRAIREPKEQLSYWFSSFVDFVKELRKLETEHEILRDNPLYGLMALKNSLNWRLNRTEYALKELDSEEIYKILRSEFAKSSDDSALLLPFFCSLINDKTNEKISNDYYIKPIKKFKNYITARLDIKLNSAEGDFQIVSVSDDKADVRKPAWLQKKGVGYQIQSYVGNLEFVAKATVDGKIDLSLRGVDIRTPEDKSKRIPYWIDYTKLTVNGEIIFDTITPAWHDKSYRYNMDAKADEEIKIQVEWQPHRSDTIETPPPKVTVPAQKITAPSKPDTVKPKIETAPKAVEPQSTIESSSQPENIESAVEPQSTIESSSQPDNVESKLETESTIESSSQPDIVKSTVEPESTIESTSQPENVESVVEPQSKIESSSKLDTVESVVEPQSTIESSSQPDNIESALEPQSTIESSSQPENIESAVEPQSTIESSSQPDIVKSTVEPESTIESTSQPENVESVVEPQSKIESSSKLDTVESVVEPQSTIESSSQPENIESAVEPQSTIESSSQPDIVKSTVEPESTIESTSQPENVESVVEPESTIESSSEPDNVESALEPQSTIESTSQPENVESVVEPQSTIESSSQPDNVESALEPQSTIESTSQPENVESVVEPQSTIESSSQPENVESAVEPQSTIESSSQPDNIESALEPQSTIESSSQPENIESAVEPQSTIESSSQPDNVESKLEPQSTIE